LKSSVKHLESRGYVKNGAVDIYANLTDSGLIDLLNSSDAVKRTIAAKIAGNRRTTAMLAPLCETLKIEKKLYTKLAVCEAIGAYGIIAMPYLVPLLGKIGKNRHLKPALVDINKKSFPLPRDIAARIIIRMGNKALPYLEKIISGRSSGSKTEAIDAIGHIAFNSGDTGSEKMLIDLYNENEDELIRWKIIRAFQSFDGHFATAILKGMTKSKNVIFREEAKRSLKRIKDRNLKIKKGTRLDMRLRARQSF
jgi:hypothetical protein